MLLPCVACQVQSEIGAVNAVAFDINAACAGFLFALQTANAYVAAGMYRNALVVGAEVLSRIMDWNDRSTCVLFGDGAGAVFAEACGESERWFVHVRCSPLLRRYYGVFPDGIQQKKPKPQL